MAKRCLAPTRVPCPVFPTAAHLPIRLVGEQREEARRSKKPATLTERCAAGAIGQRRHVLAAACQRGFVQPPPFLLPFVSHAFQYHSPCLSLEWQIMNWTLQCKFRTYAPPESQRRVSKTLRRQCRRLGTGTSHRLRGVWGQSTRNYSETTASTEKFILGAAAKQLDEAGRQGAHGANFDIKVPSWTWLTLQSEFMIALYQATERLATQFAARDGPSRTNPSDSSGHRGRATPSNCRPCPTAAGGHCGLS